MSDQNIQDLGRRAAQDPSLLPELFNAKLRACPDLATKIIYNLCYLNHQQRGIPGWKNMIKWLDRDVDIQSKYENF